MSRRDRRIAGVGFDAYGSITSDTKTCRRSTRRGPSLQDQATATLAGMLNVKAFEVDVSGFCWRHDTPFYYVKTK